MKHFFLKDVLASMQLWAQVFVFVFFGAASSVSGPVISFQMRRNVVCPHHERAAAEMRNRPSASHRVT